MRLFVARPTLVLLLAIGSLSERPSARSRAGSSMLDAIDLRTLSARAKDKA